jgi:proton-dependent oligopeptide transporter, POT family
MTSPARSFSTVLLIELWERFGFYGMQVLMVTYMMNKLGFIDTDANLVWGTAAALIFATPAVGGWIGDRWLGSRRTMLIGASVLCLGYALLWWPSQSEYFLYCALGVVIVGNGLFKPNAGNLVRKIYAGDKARIDSAFTLYYMAVNVGAMVSMTLTPLIRDYVGRRFGDSAGWHTAFGVCCLGLAVGLLNYFVMRRSLSHIGSPADAEPLEARRVVVIAGGAALVVLCSVIVLRSAWVARLSVCVASLAIAGIFFHLIRTSRQDERAGLMAAIVLVIETIFFYVFYQQMSTSLNLFAHRNVDLQFGVFGWHAFTWIPEQFQNLNAIWIVILGPLMVWIYNSLGRLGRDPPIAAKFAVGFLAIALAFFVYGIAARWAVDGRISSWTLVLGYGLYSLGELLVSGLGLAMIARYVPERMCGFMMGAYYVVAGLAQYLGSMVANLAHIPENITDPVDSLTIYTNLFDKLGLLALLSTLVAIAMIPTMTRLSARHAAAAPERLRSPGAATVVGAREA